MCIRDRFKPARAWLMLSVTLVCASSMDAASLPACQVLPGQNPVVANVRARRKAKGEKEDVYKRQVWDFTGVGPSTKIIVRDNLPIAEAGCALCGQCITHCPTGALVALSLIHI